MYKGIKLQSCISQNDEKTRYRFLKKRRLIILSALLVWEFVLNLVSIVLPTLSISTQTDKYNTAGINQEENANGFYLFPYLLALLHASLEIFSK